ncbi:MAG: hypothetical protein IJ261_00380, partial [Clostridia bacterium]|nr:hypothetical protein [Clostridia bacterium]
GILNSSLGGSSIASWLSREAIESDSLLKNAYIENGVYIERSDWDENNTNIYADMTANYNLRTHAYRNFRPSGMIWYQGETDLIYGWSHDTYAYSFDAMQQMYTDMFGFEDGFFPIIYTQIAAYHYPPNDYVLPEWNINYTEIQNTLPDSRAMITLSDLPLTYIPELGVIHPQTKEPVGQRIAWAAQAMVYGKGNTHTAATLKASEVKDGSIYATFKNVGDGLTTNSKILQGFAICGDNGIYVQAQAEIVSNDTVRIWSDEVSEPISATYAYDVSNMAANLFSSQNGEPLMPVSVFVTKKLNSAH